MWPSTPKSWSFFLSVCALVSSSSRVRWSEEAGGGASRPTAGSLNDSAPPLPKSNVSCHARPLSERLDLALGGSFTTSRGGTAASMAGRPGGPRRDRGRDGGRGARAPPLLGFRPPQPAEAGPQTAREHAVGNARDEQ